MYHDDIIQSLFTLNHGGVILYPTDTVWGIGCDATNPKAVERIYEIKKRAEKQNLLVLVDSIDMLSSYVHQVADIALQLLYLADKPISIIYPQARNLAHNLVAEDGSVGIRLIRDPFCQTLIRKFGRPVVSTSANISGEITPDIFARVQDEIRMAVDYVVHWRQDDERPAAASLIVKLNGDGTFRIIRK